MWIVPGTAAYDSLLNRTYSLLTLSNKESLKSSTSASRKLDTDCADLKKSDYLPGLPHGRLWCAREGI